VSRPALQKAPSHSAPSLTPHPGWSGQLPLDGVALPVSEMVTLSVAGGVPAVGGGVAGFVAGRGKTPLSGRRQAGGQGHSRAGSAGGRERDGSASEPPRRRSMPAGPTLRERRSLLAESLGWQGG